VPRITQLIAGKPEVLSQLGRPEDGTDATLTNNLEFFVRLKPPDQWPAGIDDLSDVIADLGKDLDAIPGIEVNFSQPIRDNVNENISGQFGQIAVKLYGSDLVALQAQAEKAKAIIAKVAGVADLGIVKSGEVPQIQVTPDRKALARPRDAAGRFPAGVPDRGGRAASGRLLEGERHFDVVMRLPLSARDDLDKIRALRVPVDGDHRRPEHAGPGRHRPGTGEHQPGEWPPLSGSDERAGTGPGGFVNEARRRAPREARSPRASRWNGAGVREQSGRWPGSPWWSRWRC
jgi:cobalt-zinc-cadmium resistance protein CzcA